MIEWKVIPGCTDVEPYCVQAFIDGKESYKVAQNLPIEDAALISAAPDLLAALEPLLMRWADPLSISERHWNDARDAIKKARGEA